MEYGKSGSTLRENISYKLLSDTPPLAFLPHSATTVASHSGYLGHQSLAFRRQPPAFRRQPPYSTLNSTR